jgi:predicted Zn-ribbon and HTH transcriptional regulator
VFDLPKDILSKLLTHRNTNPERLSASEKAIADRIAHCTLCGNFWVRRKGKLPDRCPKCHKRGWDRPLLTAMLQQAPSITHPEPAQGKGE